MGCRFPGENAEELMAIDVLRLLLENLFGLLFFPVPLEKEEGGLLGSGSLPGLFLHLIIKH